MEENWPGADIGPGRKYETMVFLSGGVCTNPECNCGQPELADPANELDSQAYNRRRNATEGHLGLCVKWSNQDKGKL